MDTVTDPKVCEKSPRKNRSHFYEETNVRRVPGEKYVRLMDQVCKYCQHVRKDVKFMNL